MAYDSIAFDKLRTNREMLSGDVKQVLSSYDFGETNRSLSGRYEVRKK